MSRLAKKPIKITSGVTVTNRDGVLTFAGAKGEQKLSLHRGVEAKMEGNSIWIQPAANAGKAGGAHVGTAWSLVKNCIEGVSAGFSKMLDIEGVGYRAVVEKNEVVLYLGYATPVRFPIPHGITIEIEKNTIMKISGNDKNLVGLVASNIRSLKKPEPYKGKGIRYRGEVIRRKVGKKAGVSAGAAA